MLLLLQQFKLMSTIIVVAVAMKTSAHDGWKRSGCSVSRVMTWDAAIVYACFFVGEHHKRTSKRTEKSSSP